MTSPSDNRIEQVCRDCARPFMVLGAWQTRCRTCYAAHKAARGETDIEALHRALLVAMTKTAILEAENASLRRQLADIAVGRDRWRRKAMGKPKAARTTKARIPPDCWRRLVQLAHPDKHGDSPAATEATRWLLENRP